MKNMGSFVWFSCQLPDLWSLNFQKLCPFCTKAVTALYLFYVYASESSCFALVENGIGYYAMT